MSGKGMMSADWERRQLRRQTSASKSRSLPLPSPGQQGEPSINHLIHCLAARTHSSHKRTSSGEAEKHTRSQSMRR